MSGRWWRAYGRARHDPKLLKLSDRHFRWWFNLVCVASDNGGTLPSHADLAVEFRVSDKAMTEALDALVAAGLLDHDETGIHPHNWNGLQYVSDSSSNRVKQFRERQRNVSETPSESETETDTEQTVAKATERAPKEPGDVKFTLPSDWQPSEPSRHHASDKGLDPANVTEAFVDWFTNGRGKRERRNGPGWEKRFRIWCNTDAERKPGIRTGVRPASTGGDAGAFARAAARMGRG